MANIREALDNFKNARYGEQIRDSLVESVEAINDEVENNTKDHADFQAKVNEKVDAMQVIVDESNEIANDAKETADNATRTANAAVETAEEAGRIANSANATAEEANRKSGNAVDVSSEAKRIAEASNATAENANSTAKNAEDVAEKSNRTANEANQTAEEANSKSDTANSVAEESRRIANDASQTANEAKTTADSAEQAASNAVTIANSANQTALAANQTSEAANKTASDAQKTATEAKQYIVTNEQRIQEMTAQKIAEIEQKGTETKESIPEDYSTLSADVGELKGDIVEIESAIGYEVNISTNIFDVNDVTLGKKLSATTNFGDINSLADKSDAFVANQIWEIKTGDTVFVSTKWGVTLSIFDADGLCLGNHNGDFTSYTISEANAKYLRMWSLTTSDTYYKNLMLSINTPLPSVFEPYSVTVAINVPEVVEARTDSKGIQHKSLSARLMAESEISAVSKISKRDKCNLYEKEGSIYNDFSEQSGNIENADISFMRNGFFSKKINVASSQYAIVSTPIDSVEKNVAFLLFFNDLMLWENTIATVTLFVSGSRYDLDNCALYNLTRSKRTQDWFLYKIAKNDFTVTGSFTWENAKYAGIKINNPSSDKNAEMIINAVIVDSMMKPIVLMSHDGIYPNSDAMSGGKLDTIESSGVRTTVYVRTSTNTTDEIAERYANLVGNKLIDFEMYASANKALLDSNENPSVQYSELLANQSGIKSNFIVGNADMYAAPNGKMHDITVQILKTLGFKSGRISGFPYLSQFTDKDFSIGFTGFYTSTDASKITSMIDYAIENGCVLPIFTHEVGNSDNAYGCSVEQFQTICNYIKEKVDNGELYTMTTKEFVDMCIT